MHRFLRYLTALLMGAAALVLLSPWLIYEATLQSIEGRPVKPVRMASAEEQAAVWKLARGSGPLHAEPLNPYLFIWKLTSTPAGQPDAGETLAYWVSREHVWALPERRGMGRWHLYNAALTIWLTRHWSAEEMASFMAPVVAKWPPPMKASSEP